MNPAARFGLAALVSAALAVGVFWYLKKDAKTEAAAPVALPAGTAPVASAATVPAPAAVPAAALTVPAAFRLEKSTGSGKAVVLENGDLAVTLDPYGAGVSAIALPKFHPHKNDAAPYILSQTPSDPNKNSLTNGYGAVDITVDGIKVSLFNALWAVTEQDATHASFAATIQAQDGKPAVRVERAWRLGTSPYAIELSQKITNLDGNAHKVSFSQVAQNDVTDDGAAYMNDQRRFALGYFSTKSDATRTTVQTKNGFVDRQQVAEKMLYGEEYRDADYKSLWPWYDIESPVKRNEAHQTNTPNDTQLAWIGSYNRYFLLATHVPVASDIRDASKLTPLETLFPTLRTVVKVSAPQGHETAENARAVLLALDTGTFELKTRDENKDLSLSIYAGPRDARFLRDVGANHAIGLSETVRFRLTEGFCGFLTFQWLANALFAFLAFLHGHVTFDWAASIIVLVLAVRLVLHPLTKKSQVSMMRFGKQMQAIQPELEKVKAKYPGDKEKLSQETMRLYKEKGINPANALGCLPMFLQMPIWSALYAMLYYAFPLRHEPGFWGVFQNIHFGGHAWQFLGDLSSSDRFITLFPDDGKHIFKLIFVQFDYSSVNLLPILMTVVMYFNMKYTQTPAATDEQKTQQTIMKVMTLVMFPLMLYSAPCGLTLYITASTLAGIVDSWIVRRHVKEMENNGTLLAKAPKEAPKPGTLRHWFAQRLEYAKAVAEAKRDGKPLPLNPKQMAELEKLKKQNPFPRGPQSRWGK